jgi:hypothetical protein
MERLTGVRRADVWGIAAGCLVAIVLATIWGSTSQVVVWAGWDSASPDGVLPILGIGLAAFVIGPVVGIRLAERRWPRLRGGGPSRERSMARAVTMFAIITSILVADTVGAWSPGDSLVLGGGYGVIVAGHQSFIQTALRLAIWIVGYAGGLAAGTLLGLVVALLWGSWCEAHPVRPGLHRI